MLLSVYHNDVFMAGLDDVVVSGALEDLQHWTLFQMWSGERTAAKCRWNGRPKNGVLEFNATRGGITIGDLKAAAASAREKIKSGEIVVYGEPRLYLMLVTDERARFWIGIEDDVEADWMVVPQK